MNSILLGNDQDTGKPVRIPLSSFERHWHLLGYTGTGKTVTLTTMLHALLADRFVTDSCVIIDRMGGFSFSLLRWFASRFCPQRVRERLIYIEPARGEDIVIGFNPLLYDTPGEGYFKVARATDIILRAWQGGTVNIEAMPRLARWTFNSFWALAQLGLNIADCAHLLLAGSKLRKPLLNCLPEELRNEWQEVLDAHGNQEAQLLESTRNRMKPYWEAPALRNMFGATSNRLNLGRFMREGKVLLINLASQNRLSEQLADAIGGLILNELFSVARSLPIGVRYPTYVFLGEFQRFVGPDIEAAIPEVRQLGIKLVLSHQSLSQLQQGDYDLTSLIFQAQNRMVFSVQHEDADTMAHEIAALQYDPKLIKDEVYSRRQLVTGHRIVELSSHSQSTSFARQWQEHFSRQHSTQVSLHNSFPTAAGGRGTAETHGSGKGGSEVTGDTQGTHQSLLPVYEQFLEVASRTYFSFEEQKMLWASAVRKQGVGQALLRLVNEPTIRAVNVRRSAPGNLGLDWALVQRRLPEVAEELDKLIARNYAQEYFVSPAVIARETQERLERVLQPVVHIPAQSLPTSPTPHPLD